MSERNVGVKCRSEMSERNVGAKCRSEMSEWNVGAKCRSGMSEWNVGAKCRSEMSEWNVGVECPWAVGLSPPIATQSPARPLTSSEKAKNDPLALRGLVIRPGFARSAVNVVL